MPLNFFNHTVQYGNNTKKVLNHGKKTIMFVVTSNASNLFCSIIIFFKPTSIFYIIVGNSINFAMY